MYPTDGAFNPGSFDLTQFDVYRDGDSIRMVTGVQGAINNPWAGNGMSTQRLNIYLKDPSRCHDVDVAAAGNQHERRRAVVAGHRRRRSPRDAPRRGVMRPTFRVGDATLQGCRPRRQIVVTIPASVFTGIDVGTAGTRSRCSATPTTAKPIGNVRPVYSAACWAGTGCPVRGRVPVRRGRRDRNPSPDEPRHRPGRLERRRHHQRPTPQSSALDWTVAAPVVVPYVQIIP